MNDVKHYYFINIVKFTRNLETYFDVIAFVEEAIGVVSLGRGNVRYIRESCPRSNVHQPGHFQGVDFGVEERLLNGHFAHQDATYTDEIN